MGQVASRIKSIFTAEKKEIFENECSSFENRSFTTGIFDDSKTKLVTPRKPLKRSFSQIIDSSLPQSFIDIFKSKKLRLEIPELVEKELPAPVGKELPVAKFLDFHFLVNEETISYFNHSKVMFIMRGLPGSGKSTIIKALADKYDSIESCSADDFFMINGKYVYQSEKIGEAHRHCQLKAIDSAQRQINIIAIDNTNVQFWEMKFYFELAAEYNYLPIIVEPQTPWKTDLEILEEKNSHGINKEIIGFKLAGFKKHMPLYCGWFVNERDSYLIRDQAMQWLKEGFKHPQFIQDCEYFYGVKTLEELECLFPELISNSTLLHCTSKYIGRGRAYDSEEYLTSKEVIESMHKVYKLEICGYVFTPRTYGARIRLNEEEVILWAQDDFEEIPDYFYHDQEENLMDTDINDENCDISASVDSINGEVVENSINCHDISMENKNCDNFKENDKKTSATNGTDNPNALINGNSINGDVFVSTDPKNLSPVKMDDSNSESLNVKEANIHSVQSLNQHNVIHAGSPRTPTKDPKNLLKVRTPKKSPRKQKGKGVEIPQNEIYGDQSATKSFINFMPNDFGIETIVEGSRAHLTLGCAEGISPVITGLDILFGSHLEQQDLNSTIEKSFDTQGGRLKSYGNGVWIVYPREKLIVSSIFSTYG